MGKRSTGKPRKQVAALPIARGPDGSVRVLVITSRATRRFIVPKGWPMKGRKDHHAAEIEAREEAGLVGRAHRKPLGVYFGWKRGEHDFQPVRVKVYLLDVEGRLDSWKEKGQRLIAWLGVEEAAALIDEPGLADLVLGLPQRLPKGWQRRAKAVPHLDSAGAQDSASPAKT